MLSDDVGRFYEACKLVGGPQPIPTSYLTVARNDDWAEALQTAAGELACDRMA